MADTGVSAKDLDGRQMDMARRFDRGLAMLTAVTALFVLLGWKVKSSLLVQIVPGFAPMQFNTALCFAILAIALLLQPWGRGRPSTLVNIPAAVAIFVLAGLSMMGYVTDVSLGVETWFNQPFTVDRSPAPGRMSPTTATGFIIGAFMLLAPLSRRRWSDLASAGLAMSIIAMSAVTEVAYLIEQVVPELQSGLTLMAIHTAACFLFVGVAGLLQTAVVRHERRRRRWFLPLSWTAVSVIVGLLLWLVVFDQHALSGDGYSPLATVSLFLLLPLLGLMSAVAGFWIVQRQRANRLHRALNLARQRRWADMRRKNAEMAAINERLADLNTQLAETVAALKASNSELEQFAYVASHDLKEPLRMITSSLQLIERRQADNLDPTCREFMGYAVLGATRMQLLIDDLLTYSRVNNRKLEREWLDVSEFMEFVLDDMDVRISELNATISLHDLPERVWADRSLLHRIMLNLIGNALKFQADTPPVISISGQETDTHWRFQIMDNGIGINPKYAQRVFKIFQRLHTRDDYEGNGIGLSICQQSVIKHGGTITHSPRPDGGSGCVFTFTLKKPERHSDD